jgi:ribose-phosphate pyrophosphokinase
MKVAVSNLHNCHIAQKFSIPFIPVDKIHTCNENEILLVHSVYDYRSLAELSEYLIALKDRDVTLLAPYIKYSRNSRNLEKFASLVKQKYGVSKILSVDLHNPNTYGIINISMSRFWDKFVGSDSVVVAPDNGASVRAGYVYDLVLEKIRLQSGVKVNNSYRDILFNDRVFIVDDIIDTGATVIAASRLIYERYGCDRIALCTTHGVFMIKRQGVEDLLQDVPFISEIYVTDSVTDPSVLALPEKYSIVGCADYIWARLSEL